MVLILNLLPIVILFLGLYIAYRYIKRKQTRYGLKVLAVTAIVLFVYLMAMPSYIPKGEARTTLPAVEYVAPRDPLPVENRLREARIEENNKEHAEAFDWRKQIQENKGEKVEE